ncbi:MAG TPA: 2'-5' RNA ligase family protein, partial [Propionibacteriaceae bacterium]|nr:2'-5' RNA ligase family protein [Propionibacteriaceae bacterium]
YAGIADPGEVLQRLATSCRTAATTVGIEVARQAYVPHVTLARRNRASDASRHVRALSELATRSWEVTELVLVESFLGQGAHRGARHEVRERLPLSGS